MRGPLPAFGLLAHALDWPFLLAERAPVVLLNPQRHAAVMERVVALAPNNDAVLAPERVLFALGLAAQAGIWKRKKKSRTIINSFVNLVKLLRHAVLWVVVVGANQFESIRSIDDIQWKFATHKYRLSIVADCQRRTAARLSIWLLIDGASCDRVAVSGNRWSFFNSILKFEFENAQKLINANASNDFKMFLKKYQRKHTI